jgi:hypothetical protein
MNERCTLNELHRPNSRWARARSIGGTNGRRRGGEGTGRPPPRVPPLPPPYVMTPMWCVRRSLGTGRAETTGKDTSETACIARMHCCNCNRCARAASSDSFIVPKDAARFVVSSSHSTRVAWRGVACLVSPATTARTRVGLEVAALHVLHSSSAHPELSPPPADFASKVDLFTRFPQLCTCGRVSRG